MARLDLEDLGGQELTRVYIAGDLKEAERVESALAGRGIDFAVDIEPYLGTSQGFISNRYLGAVFLVPPALAALARRVLLAAGLTKGLEDEVVD